MASAVTLLCLPCAGASATMYLRWRRLLPSWIQVEPVELPGRGLRMAEPCIEDFDTLVAHLCALHAPRMAGPHVLFGHSLGGLLAYGMARERQRQKLAPAVALVASASPAPSRRRDEGYPAKGDDAALLADLRRQGGTPDAVFDDPELIRITLDTLGADYRLCESYDSTSTAQGLTMPLHVLAGRDDDIGAARIEAWRDEAANGFTLDWFDGGHFYFRECEAEMLETLQRRLRQSLAQANHGLAVFA